MPAGTRVAKALAHLKQAQAAFEAFSLETHDEGAKAMYHDAAVAAEVLANFVERRLDTIRAQEPEYRPKY
jgi:Ran GTPase-activating protein (RanGAP) involved in mRNA processing and transport